MTKLVASLLLALAGLVATAAHAQDVKRGEQRAAQCIGCHGIAGYQSSFPEVHRVPMISGQSAQYIVASLQAYAKGERKHPTMRGVAGMLTSAPSASRIAAITAWGAAMHPAWPVPFTPSPFAAVGASSFSVMASGGRSAARGSA